MVKFLKTGRVVIVLAGRQAGKKAVILQNSEFGNKERPYGHCVVAGVEKPPQRLLRRMTRKALLRRSRVGAFLKVYNHKHLMPTRYNMELGTELRGKISIADPTKRVVSKKTVQKVFQHRFNLGKNLWFFKKLRF
eukprot:NODE_6173_length_563_cov_363.137615_g6008_i0.p1 GENE.NODE_6173_length_563_cov_363.137615_g6008_i0~~NODE_6173_length_563_cov_363.137615_g6008_i0.p1  ORF type:complete len:156 (-),score=24.51 NODE_6173_length_563_cov_363.137615_g6008_i0:96-500(-)